MPSPLTLLLPLPPPLLPPLPPLLPSPPPLLPSPPLPPLPPPLLLLQVIGPGSPLAPFVVYPRREGCAAPGARSVTLQPALLSAAALRRVGGGLALGGISAQCAAFNSTHDAGLSVFLWMHAVGLQRDLGQVHTALERWAREGRDPGRFVVHRVKFAKDFDAVAAAFGPGGPDGRLAAAGLPGPVAGAAAGGGSGGGVKGRGSGGGSGGGDKGGSGGGKRTSGGTSGTTGKLGGGSAGSRNPLRVDASLAWLASLGAPPPPTAQLGYLSTQHHLQRLSTGRSGPLKGGDGPRGVADHVASGEWPTYTAEDCMSGR